MTPQGMSERELNVIAVEVDWSELMSGGMSIRPTMSSIFWSVMIEGDGVRDPTSG